MKKDQECDDGSIRKCGPVPTPLPINYAAGPAFLWARRSASLLICSVVLQTAFVAFYAHTCLPNGVVTFPSLMYAPVLTTCMACLWMERKALRFVTIPYVM